uniref:Amino acid transporter transmembrane domain-containing protein n=1 Tax=Zea mays TaxID=4577 RepID=A0A804PS13_MAIZE
MATQARENHRHSFTTKDERSGEGAEDQAIDDWLPITSSRNAKWWYSAFHNVTAMVGAGVLSLPYAMSKLGWGPGIAVLMLSWVVTLYTMWQMVEMHEMVPGKRFDRYHELGQHAFGERLGLWIVVPQQLIVEVGGDIVFMVTGGRSLKKLHDVVVCDAAGRCSEGGGDIRLTYFIMIFASCHLLLSQLPNFNSISGDGVGEGVELHGGAGGRGVRVRGAQRGSGDPGHHPVHAGDPVQEAHVEGRRGRLRHGRRLLLPRLATRVLGLRQPGRRQRPRHAQQAPVAHRPRQRHGRRPCHWQLPDFRDAGVRHDGDGPGEETAFPARPCPPSHCPEHLSFTTFIAITIPFFGGLLGFFGGFAFAPTTYFLPCVMWLAICKPKRFSLSWFANWACIVLGVVLMVLAPIGALRQIILSAKTYRFYS